VGTFTSEAAARAAAINARREADNGEARVEAVRLRHKTVWRAKVVGLTPADAQDACSGRRKGTCTMMRAGGRQVASR
jgi:hypothetical protein